MSDMFLDRGHRHYKDDTIWTDVNWSQYDIPKTWLHTKFSLFMDTVPHPEQWITFIPDSSAPGQSSFVGNYFAAGFGTKSLETHKEIIKFLTNMYKKDRFAFSHIVVVDARHCIIGPDYPQDDPVPFLVDHEILSGRRIHRNPGDGPHDEFFLDNSKKNATGTVIAEKDYIGYRQYKIYKCRESNMKPDVYLRYCKNGKQTLSGSNLSYFETMSTIHQHHIQWLLQQREIPRECHQALRTTYENDLILEKRMEERMVKILLKKLAKFEWKLYIGEQHPTDEWYNLDFKHQMASIYDGHKKWLMKESSISHTIHCRLSKIYKDDVYMPEDTKKQLSNIINIKFGAYLEEIHDDPPSRKKAAAHRYWIEKIPVVQPELAPLIPFDCW